MWSESEQESNFTHNTTYFSSTPIYLNKHTKAGLEACHDVSLTESEWGNGIGNGDDGKTQN